MDTHERLIIAAVDQAFNIGLDGRLPWPAIPEDMAFFKGITMGNIVIMGSKTYASLPGNHLPGRHLIVISRDWHYYPATPINLPTGSVTFVVSYNTAMELAEQLTTSPEQTIVIAGGASVYRQALEDPTVTTALITVIPDTFPADRKFPRVPVQEDSAWVSDHSISGNLITKQYGPIPIVGLRRQSRNSIELYL